MSYLVTARKWRPTRFDEIVGQEHISTTLKNAIKNNRIAHAYIFAGPRGVGKTTTARIFAKIINCIDPQNGEPCNKCELCKAFNNSQTMDIIEIDGASNRRIDEIRSLRESVKYTPTRGKYKVYIIDEVHMLTTESFNALLKTLEEPPEHTIFIFATTDIHKVPATIISRCQRFDFRRIDVTSIKHQLAKISEADKIKIDDKTLTIIAKKADGALRDAQSLFDQIAAYCNNEINYDIVSKMLNLIDDEIYFELTDSILNKNFAQAFKISRIIYDNGWNIIDFVNELTEHFRNIFTVVITGENNLIETAEIYKEKYQSYKDKFTEGDLLRILSYLGKVQQELKYTQNQRLKIEITLLTLIGFESSTKISELLYSIKNEEVKDSFSTISNSEEESSIFKQKNLSRKSDIVEKVERNIISEPIIEKFTPPVSDLSGNFDEMVTKWKSLVEQIQKEKFFGSILANTRLVSFRDNLLTIELEHSTDKDIIEDESKYLNNKFSEIFGKQFAVNYISKEDNFPANESKNSENASPIVNLIINDLGGKEII